MTNRLVLENRFVIAAIVATETLAAHYKDKPGLIAQMTYEAMDQCAKEIRRQCPEVSEKVVD